MKLVYPVVFTLATAASIASASAQTGPVATACTDDIAKLCSGRAHDGETRICLEVSAACKKALDTTGGGRAKGLGRGK